MQCRVIYSCSFARSGGSYVFVHYMISAAREVAQLSKKFSEGCWREKERERGEDKGLKKHFVILLMASGTHINATESSKQGEHGDNFKTTLSESSSSS